MTQTIDDTLAERGSRYGEFESHAAVTQAIKAAMAAGFNWVYLEDDQRESLEMVAHKIGRILNGDASYIDSWTDIIGYVRLVEKRLIAEQTEPKADFDKECQCPVCADDREVQREAGVPKGSWGDSVAGQYPVEEPRDDDFVRKLYGRLVKLNAKEASSSKPSDDEVDAALNVLLAAGVITAVEEDGDA
jgi:hypothetical protein